jgi:hypothetical protein
MCHQPLFHPGRSIPALALPLLMAAVLAPEPAGAQTVNGNSKAGPLTTHIYTLRIPPPIGDTLPPGGGIFYVFSVFDTGSTLVGIDTTFDAPLLEFFNPTVPALLDVRLWGLDAVQPVGLGAPLDFPEAEIEDIGVDVVPVGTPTLIGGPVTNQTVADIDYTTSVTRGDYCSPNNCFVISPSIEFFNTGGPGIPSPLMWADLVPFGSTAPAPNGTSRGQRYYVADMTFEHGGSSVDSTTHDFLYDTGNTTTQVTEGVANLLGINLAAVVDTITIGGETLNGYQIDRVSILSSNGTQQYEIVNPLVFVKPPPAFGGAADANIGTNFFETTQVLFDGPGDRLGINKAVPEPGGSVALVSGLALLAALHRRRMRGRSGVVSHQNPVSVTRR